VLGSSRSDFVCSIVQQIGVEAHLLRPRRKEEGVKELGNPIALTVVTSQPAGPVPAPGADYLARTLDKESDPGR
jgi:hypothetical protein